MKKFLPIIIGLIAGVITSGIMIYADSRPVAFGEDGTNGWEDYQAWNEENLSWKNIFSKTSTPGKDLYKFVGWNLIKSPEDEAIKVVASIYGLTPQEASQAVKGSITVLFNNTSTPKHMSTEDAYKMQADIIADYESYKELFDIQQEIDTSVTPTEMFANGDLLDSGFDLIYDLDVMEKILFDGVTNVTSGKPLPDSGSNLKSFLDAAEQPTSTGNKKVTIKDKAVDPADVSSEPSKQIEIKIGDQVLEADIVEDVCPDNNTLADSLGKFDKENPPGSKNNPDTGSKDKPASGANNSPESDNPSDKPTPVENYNPESKLTPAPEAKPSGGFCGETTVAPGAPEFSSLGGAANSEGSPLSMGFSVNVALCIKIEIIKTAATASETANCIQCEIVTMNGALNEMLGHSMIPNKTTGNIMESATCKKSFRNALDLKVLLVPNALPADPADDLIFGKNIFAEWNKFVDRYKPQGNSKWDKDTAEEFAFTYVNSSTSSDKLVLSIEKSKADNLAKLESDIKAMNIADEATNMTLSSDPILDHMREMTAYFKAYKNMFDLVATKTCPTVLSKKTID